MKFQIPPIVRPLDLAEYAPEISTSIHVWVNPPRALLMQYYDAVVLASNARNLTDKEQAGQLEQAGLAMMEWAASIWSAGPEETRWTTDEVNQLWEHCFETDPALWPWLINRTIEMIEEHRQRTKKK